MIIVGVTMTTGYIDIIIIHFEKLEVKFDRIQPKKFREG